MPISSCVLTGSHQQWQNSITLTWASVRHLTWRTLHFNCLWLSCMFKYYIDVAYSNSVILLCSLVMFRVRWFQSNKHFQETKINLLRCPAPVDQAIWACRPGAQGPDKISNGWGLGSFHVGLRCIKMCVHLFHEMIWNEMKWNDKLEGMFILYHFSLGFRFISLHHDSSHWFLSPKPLDTSPRRRPCGALSEARCRHHHPKIYMIQKRKEFSRVVLNFKGVINIY